MKGLVRYRSMFALLVGLVIGMTLSHSLLCYHQEGSFLLANDIPSPDDLPKTQQSQPQQPQPQKQLQQLQQQAWCPSAQCLDSDLCHPCNRRFLLILTLGRTASTTLIWMLDSLPGVRMSGENANTLHYIRIMFANLEEHRAFHHKGGNRQIAWGHYPIPDGSFACVGQSMIQAINPPRLVGRKRLLQDDSSTIIGFKTIRLFDEIEDPAQDEKIYTFLQDTFPCARFVVNIRSDAAAQAASQNAAFPKQDSKNASHNEFMTLRLLRLAQAFGPERAFVLDSTQWTTNVTQFNEMVRWMGFGEACYFSEILEYNTKGKYGLRKESKSRVPFGPDCKAL